MNKTRIDWADMTWNPITGCRHQCPYCYAEKIAKRFGKMMPDKSLYPIKYNGCHMLESGPKTGNPFPWQFEPTFHAHRIDEPLKEKTPRDIFTVSMGDMFGYWVPDEWIQEVFATCVRAPQHRYLFLTKNPMRYERLEAVKGLPWADNFWFGTSCTKPGDRFIWFKDKKFHWFISIEPLHGPMTFKDMQHMPEWVIIGAETGNRKGKVIPEREWVMHIKEQCKAAGVPVWMKDSLRELMGADFEQDKPWWNG